MSFSSFRFFSYDFSYPLALPPHRILINIFFLDWKNIHINIKINKYIIYLPVTIMSFWLPLLGMKWNRIFGYYHGNHILRIFPFGLINVQPFIAVLWSFFNVRISLWPCIWVCRWILCPYLIKREDLPRRISAMISI